MTTSESPTGTRRLLALLGDLRGQALLVVLGGLVCQMGLGFGYTFGPLARDIISEFDWTRATYSAARAPQLFVIALASPVIGTLAVRFGARRVLATSTLLLGLTFLLLGRMQGLWQFYALVILYGISITGLGDITVGQLVSQWVERGRGLALGLVYTGSNVGGFAMIPFATALAERGSWRESFLGMGAVGLLLMLPVALFVVREPGRSRVEEVGPGPEPASRAPVATDMDLRAALRTRSFWILAVSLFSFFFYFLGMAEHLVLFLTDAGMPREEAAAHFGRAVGLGVVSKIGLGLLADRIPHKAAILLDYALLAASSLLLLALPNPTLLPIFVVSYGFATAARDVVYPLMVNYCFGVRYMAQIYGGLMLALLPGGALGPIFAAAVHDRTGSYDFAFLVFALLNVASVLSLALLRREIPEPAPEPA